jgi:hypothetical protein
MRINRLGILSGGLVLGFLASLLRDPAPRVRSRAEQVLIRRIKELAAAVAALEKRIESGVPLPDPAAGEVLAAVDNIVAARIGGIDQRIQEQAQAVELLREASAQTDVLLERLITAIHALVHQAEPREEAAEKRTVAAAPNSPA